MSASVEPWTKAVLDYWFGEVGPRRWWSSGTALDAEIETRFAALWHELRARPHEDFLDTPETALAAIVLFDQFSRNLFRDEARAFAADDLALAIAKGAVAADFDAKLDDDQRSFLYMPFMHSEALADQERSLELFGTLGEGSRKYARDHYDLIARFGRFPHRNAALGRETLPEEAAAAECGKNW